ncbi:invasion associated locus B family protein [Pseudooceanicola sp. MF1-13]|uniref:invasion associated locus B family protein n=1 Tax=Pseudooceanicola sp. MF1-13 TaxID=3379095 RepID=UPI003891F7E2
MNTTKTFLSVLALAAFSGAAIAQDTTTAAPAEEQTTEEAQAAPATDPTLDTGVADDETVGAGYVREENGDWQTQCVRAEDPATEPCQLYQLLRGAENNPVAEVIIEKLPAGGQVAAGATILVPHGTALARDMRIAVDGGKGKVYRYAFCDSNACYARIGLLPEDIASFKQGAGATVTLFAFERLDNPVELSLSLSGFTAGYDALPAKTAP